MQKYSDLTFWQNSERRQFLEDYRAQVVKYFKLVSYQNFSREPVESEKSRPIRASLNKNSRKATKYLLEAGVFLTIDYTDPPAIGGRRSRINLLANIFNLSSFDIPVEALLDLFDQAIGVYEQDFKGSKFRTFSPFFWLGQLFSYLSSLPFKFLGGLGLNSEKLEDSRIGLAVKKLIQYTFWICGVFWPSLIALGVIPSSLSIIQFIRSIIAS